MTERPPMDEGDAPATSGPLSGAGRAPAIERPLVRAGLRGFLELTWVDVVMVVGLTLLAFALRFWSPILPNFLGGAAPGAPALQVVGVAAAGTSATAACDTVEFGSGDHTVEGCGAVFDERFFPIDAADDLHSPAISYFSPVPPLVKLLMTPSIALLGFNPLGWRMTQVVTGSLLVGLMYLIALRLRRDRFFAIVASLLVCLDGLAFVESRIGLLDIPAIFFSALVWYLLLLHWQARTRRQWRITLYVTAAALGLALAAKLTAIAPLAVAVALIGARGLAPYAAAAWPALRRLAGPRSYETVLWREAAGRRAVLHYAAGIVLVGMVFCAADSRYLTIPHDVGSYTTGCNPEVAGIPTLPYPNDVTLLPVPVTTLKGLSVPNVPQAIANIVQLNEAELRYEALDCHGNPTGSRWYTWPVMQQPVLMYYQSTPLLDNPGQGVAIITDMGNPAVWWLGLLALLFCVWRMTAGPRKLRFGVCALMVASLTTMIVTFHAAEPPTSPVSGYELSSPLGPLSPLFYVGFAGMFVFAGAATTFAVVSRRFVPAFIVLGYTAAWLMWALGNKMTVLYYYLALGMLIFAALALAYMLTAMRGVRFYVFGRWWSLAPLAFAGIAVVVAAFIFFYPIWTAVPLTSPDAHMRLWVDA